MTTRLTQANTAIGKDAARRRYTNAGNDLIMAEIEHASEEKKLLRWS